MCMLSNSHQGILEKNDNMSVLCTELIFVRICPTNKMLSLTSVLSHVAFAQSTCIWFIKSKYVVAMHR
jgi:hypothetical protein